MHPSENKTAVVVDRYPMWLEAMEHVLGRLRVSVVGRTVSAAEGYQLVCEHEPDVLITDIETEDEGPDPLWHLRRARNEYPQLKCIVLSAYDDSEHIEAALAAGAIAYVVKTAHPDDFAAAIRQSFDHSVFMAGAQAGPPAEKAEPAGDTCGLTRRELEILRLVAEGHSNAEMAKMLWVTEQTVKFHLSNIYRKLDVSNRTAASRWAQIQGLLPGNPSAAIA